MSRLFFHFEYKGGRVPDDEGKELANLKEAHRYALRLVKILAERDPAHYILSAQGNRRGRIFLDYLRNGRGTTAIGTYSPRAREGFPIAAPVTWSRIEAGIRPDVFTMKSPFRVRSNGTASRPVRKRA